MSKQISQNAIGRALNLSSANMVKMKKQGCPMDSVESVRAWRAKHQNIAQRKPEPGDVSGSGVGLGHGRGDSVPAPGAEPTGGQAARAPGAEPINGAEGAGITAMIRARQVDDSGDYVSESFESARIRDKIAEANLKEVALAREVGKLLPLDQATRAALMAARGVRDALQASRRRLAPALAAATSVQECEELLRKDHINMLANLSSALAAVAPGIDVGEATQA